MEHSNDLQIILDFLNIKEPRANDYCDCVSRCFVILQAAGWNLKIESTDEDYHKWKLNAYNKYRPTLEVTYNAHMMTNKVLEAFMSTVIDYHKAQMGAIPKDDD